MVLSEDREKWDKLFVDMSSLLFDPFSSVLLAHLDVVGATAATRRWSVRAGLDDEAVGRLSMALRMAKDLGVAVLGVLRLEHRHKWKNNLAPMMMVDGEHELPVALHVAETIIKTTHMFIPGARLPPAIVIADGMNPHWWGVLAATIPIEAFVATLREFFTDFMANWAAKPENKGLVISATAFRAARAKRAADEAHIAAAAAVVGRPPLSHRTARPNRHTRHRRHQLESAGAAQTTTTQALTLPSPPPTFAQSPPADGPAAPAPPQWERGNARRGGRGRFGGGRRGRGMSWSADANSGQ